METVTLAVPGGGSLEVQREVADAIDEALARARQFGEGEGRADAGRDQPRNVIEALARVMADLPGIAKSDESEQGYKYRGIEAITAHAQRLLGKWCVVFVPHVEHRDTTHLTINNRPWTQEELRITYTVYGPGGVDDSIVVGPIYGLGRDNSDKGANKAMTQAYKYALLQTLCIGDSKDDADAGEAAVADAPLDPAAAEKEAARQERVAAADRIRALEPEQRAEVGAWCDEQGFGRIAKKWTDEQLVAVTEHLDGLAIAKQQDAQATGDEEGQERSPASPEAADDPPEGATPANDEDKAAEANTEDAAGEVVLAPEDRALLDSLPQQLIEQTVTAVNTMKPREVDAELRAADQPTNGNIDARRLRLTLVRLRKADPPQ